jgi:hypothetical protein
MSPTTRHPKIQTRYPALMHKSGITQKWASDNGKTAKGLATRLVSSAILDLILKVLVRERKITSIIIRCDIHCRGEMSEKKRNEQHDSDDAEEVLDDSAIEGTETEEDLGSVDPAHFGKAIVSGTDWTADTIISQLSKGNIDLDPTFQRRDAWTQSRKSKFIESIILGLPIPQLVLAETQDSRGTFIVIDGKQRLLSLQQFAGINLEKGIGPLLLKGLTVRKELNGKTYEDLRGDSRLRSQLTAFENQSIRTVVVRNWQNEKLLYIIFHRLNTNSLPLSPQELRQALHPGDFLRYIVKKSEESVALQRVLNLKKPDFRMRDVELLLRYFAYANFAADYSGNLKDFLDTTCKKLNAEWNKRTFELKRQADQCERAINTTFRIFGEEEAFRKWDGKKFERRFNRAVFEVMVYYFSKKTVRQQALTEGRRIVRTFKRLCEDKPRFLKSLETTTKSLKATSTRFSEWGRALKSLGLEVQTPRFRRRGRRN